MKRGSLLENQTLRTKLIVSVVITTVLSMVVNLFLFGKVNGTIESLDQVYATSIRLSELEQSLTDIQDKVYEYLNTQSASALEGFHQERSQFGAMIGEMDGAVTSHPVKRLERNIKNLSISYLEKADIAVAAKQVHNVNRYKDSFAEIQNIYRYLLANIRSLDSYRFQMNSENYGILYRSLKYLEVFMISILVCVGCYVIVILYLITGSITRPLVKLAGKAKEVGRGNLDIELEPPRYEDEVGTVTLAFNQMIVSIKDYIRQTKESMEMEIHMKEQELKMENLLKDAQLKYYQAQINPHFLFNTLNAGQQLAMMEDAERTYAFMENMSAFFRYRLRKSGEESTLREEIRLVDNYMYIMNVRYSGEIHLIKEMDDRLLGLCFPGMILQPIVENAIRYGVNGIEREKRIHFSVCQEGEQAVIVIGDNGMGIAREKLEQMNRGDFQPPDRDSGNGVGLNNVKARLELYYGRTDVLEVSSDGVDKGTEVTIRVPLTGKEVGYVSDTDCG